jgi:outer membrane protein OmpA-like peptidoglycan-associated protein
MNKTMIACSLAAMLAAQPALAAGGITDEAPRPPRAQQLWGLGIGGALGALAGGPLGLIVGGVLGTQAGWAAGLEADLDETRLALAESREALARAEDSARVPITLAYREPPAARDADRARIAAAIASGVSLAVQFRTDSETVEAHQVEQLQRFAGLMAELPALRLRLAGHADPRGAEAHNLRLSARRVEAVRRVLVEAGIEPARIAATAYGDRRPLSAPGDREGYAFDRRVTVFLELDEPAPGSAPALLGALSASGAQR